MFLVAALFFGALVFLVLGVLNKKNQRQWFALMAACITVGGLVLLGDLTAP